MKNITSLLLLCLSTTACNATDATAIAKVAKPQARPSAAAAECASGDACSKIGSEDTQMILVEQDRARRKGISEAGSDRQRWSTPIYSDSTRPDDLQVALVKASGLAMRLAPKLGILYFEKPGKSHGFKIAAAPGEPGAMCPKYNFRVISASERHALIGMNCPAFEYKVNRSSMSSEYILYDAQTGTTKSIWFATAGKGEKFPYAEPIPDVKVEKNGYSFQWTGVFPGSPAGVNTTINNSYTVAHDPKSGKNYLQCRDLSLPKQEQVDSEACQGLILYALPNNK